VLEFECGRAAAGYRLHFRTVESMIWNEALHELSAAKQRLVEVLKMRHPSIFSSFEAKAGVDRHTDRCRRSGLR
jgi:hypothetical protein